MSQSPPESHAPIRLTARQSDVTLHVEDCIAGMGARLRKRSVDVVVTSPPYNLGIKYGTYKDDESREQYLAWTDQWMQALAAVLSERGSFFLNLAGKPSDPWGPLEVATIARKYFQLQNTIHWIKSIAIMKEDVGDYPGITKDVVIGHYKPINSACYINDAHEYVFHFSLDGRVPLDRLVIGVPYQDRTNVGRWKSATAHEVHCRGNTWFVPYKTIQHRDKERPHPATFPPKLVAMCVRLHGVSRCRSLLDPFMGIGSTAEAGVQLGIPQVIGFDIDAEYTDWAAGRLKGEVAPDHGPRQLGLFGDD